MNARAALIAQMARARGLDPKAVLAIASVEGGFHGAVGDNGTSFGPFQLHEGGALPQGKGNAWANSKQGIAYALDSMVKDGIAGLRGQAAVAAISSKFERPANVPGEISKAMGRYGQFGGGFSGGSNPAMSTAPGQLSQGGSSPQEIVAAQLLQQAAQLSQPVQAGQPSPLSPMAAGALSNPASLLAMAMQQKAMASAQPAPPQGKIAAGVVKGGFGSSSNAGGFLPSGLGFQYNRHDQGRDIQTRAGAPIIAPGSGYVVRVGSDPGGGGAHFGPHYPIVHFTSGPYAGHDIYIGHTVAALGPGAHFGAGAVISHTQNSGPLNGGAPSGWAEIGFAPGGTPGVDGQPAPF